MCLSTSCKDVINGSRSIRKLRGEGVIASVLIGISAGDEGGGGKEVEYEQFGCGKSEKRLR